MKGNSEKGNPEEENVEKVVSEKDNLEMTILTRKNRKKDSSEIETSANINYEK